MFFASPRARRLGLVFLALGFLLAISARTIFVSYGNILGARLWEIFLRYSTLLFVLCILWIYRARQRIYASISKPAWGALFMLLPALFLLFVGVRGIQIRLELVAVACAVMSVVWLLVGRRVAALLVIPVLFYIFLLPLNPSRDCVSDFIHLAGAKFAAFVLSFVKPHLVAVGATVRDASGRVIAEVAGYQNDFFIVFRAFGLFVILTMIFQSTFRARIPFLIAAAPVAFVGYLLRSVLVVVVESGYWAEWPICLRAQCYGIPIWGLTILMYLLMWALIRPKNDVPREISVNELQPISRLDYAVVGAGFFLIGMTLLAVYGLPAPRVVAKPELAPPRIYGCICRAIQPDRSEVKGLPADTRILRWMYQDSERYVYCVSAVTGGKERASIHRPEHCIPAHHRECNLPHVVTIDGRDWQVLTIYDKGNRQSAFAYTFENQNEFYTASHTLRNAYDMWVRAVYNRIDAWTMFTITAFNQDEEALVKFIKAWQAGR